MWTYNYVRSPDELCHHGILGMKWGVRRYQNKDGSLTSAGKKRYDQNDWSDDAKEASRLKKKSVSQMSNAELRKLTERQQLERNYANLNPSRIKKGLAVATTAATVLGTITTLYTNGDKLVKLGKKVADTIVKKKK
jgi:hypothetical protein